MRFSKTAVVALIGAVGAVKLTEHDKLAALGLINVERDVAKNGYPSPGTCTPKNVAVRKEWYVSSMQSSWHRLTWLKVASLKGREEELYRSNPVHTLKACADASGDLLWSKEPLR
jgi:hypothetical protein